MDSETAGQLAKSPFTYLYTCRSSDHGWYFEYCRAIRGGTSIGDENNERHLEHLALYERTERGDFDGWLATPLLARRLIFHAVSNCRCDVIERYAPLLSSESYWNARASRSYRPPLYSVLPLIMPLPATIADAVRYVVRGLCREVVIHMVGHVDYKTGKTITIEGIGGKAAKYSDSDVGYRLLLDLESVGLNLSNPKLLHKARYLNDEGPAINLLQERCRS